MISFYIIIQQTIACDASSSTQKPARARHSRQQQLKQQNDRKKGKRITFTLSRSCTFAKIWGKHDTIKAKCQRYKCSFRLFFFFLFVVFVVPLLLQFGVEWNMERKALALDLMWIIYAPFFRILWQTVNYLGIYIKSRIDGKFCCLLMMMVGWMCVCVCFVFNANCCSKLCAAS